MANPTLRGTLDPLRQHYGEQWNPGSGFRREYTYKNFDEFRIRQLYGALVTAGVSCDLNHAFGVWTLHAIDTTGEETIDKWELNVDEEQPSALQNPRNIAAAGSLAVMEVIALALKEGIKLSEAHDQIQVDTGNSYPAPPYNAAVNRLYNRMRLGSTQYQKSTLILRHTTNAPDRWQRNVADVGVDMLYSQAAMLSECMSAALWIYPLPGALQYAITQFYNNFTPPPLAFKFWSWLKSGSPRVTVANNRVDIATQFKLDQWSTDEYQQF